MAQVRASWNVSPEIAPVAVNYTRIKGVRTSSFNSNEPALYTIVQWLGVGRLAECIVVAYDRTRRSANLPTPNHWTMASRNGSYELTRVPATWNVGPGDHCGGGKLHLNQRGSYEFFQRARTDLYTMIQRFGNQGAI